MKIKQFEYEPLSHFSYALISDGKMAIIDPQRDPIPYYDFATENQAEIVAVFETHPHADFVSSHLQIHRETGATIYNSAKLGAEYPHDSFDNGDRIAVGGATLSAINTPGHSPDSITIVAESEGQTALFTGDTLFIGDVGRPDLREKAGNMTAKRRELAEMMYDTILNKFTDLPDSALVYPAHGAGSLCGKNLSSDKSSTLGNERMGNWAFKEQDKEAFVSTLLDSQPFIPSYFGFNVDVNKSGAQDLRKALSRIPFRFRGIVEGLIVDTRDKEAFKKAHVSGSINIQATSETDKFETWLGSIIRPGEAFHLVVARAGDVNQVLDRVSKIGYEEQVASVVTPDPEGLVSSSELDLAHFRRNPAQYTIVDIRNQSEIDEGSFFEGALSCPLNDLRNNLDAIPTDKPIVVHCAGGYRSAAGSSILERSLEGATVYDLSDSVKEFE